MAPLPFAFGALALLSRPSSRWRWLRTLSACCLFAFSVLLTLNMVLLFPAFAVLLFRGEPRWWGAYRGLVVWR